MVLVVSLGFIATSVLIFLLVLISAHLSDIQTELSDIKIELARIADAQESAYGE